MVWWLPAVGPLVVVAPPVASSWSLRSSVGAIQALQERTSAEGKPLSLLSDTFDSESGLCSEGVWHNAWFGTACLLSARELRRASSRPDQSCAEAEALVGSAVTLAESLHTLSFTPLGFRRRTASGIWESVDGAREAIERAGEDPAFYQPSEELRCAPNAAAVIFYSLLAEERPHDEAARARCLAIGDAFTSSFFDESVCRFRRAADAVPIYRALDQSLGALACLRLARMGHRTAATRAMATCGMDSLLREFGYSLYAREGQPAGNYLGAARPRNSWHDSLACLALVVSNCLGVGGETPAGLLRAMAADYAAADGLLSHSPRERQAAEASPVCYTSTQAIWSAVLRSAADVADEGEPSSEPSTAEETVAGIDFAAGLRAFAEANVQQGAMPVSK
jgi:hypothetical protein